MLHCQRIAKRTGLQHFCQHQRPRQPLLARSTSLVVSEVDKRYTRKLAIDEKTLELLRLSTPTDLYELLSFPISYDAAYGEAELAKQLAAISGDEIKSSYRRLQKLSHPDLAGEGATALAALLNLAYSTLSDPDSRAAYDSELRTYRRGTGTYDGRPVSFWAGPQGETRAVFVDETTCIGCGMCNLAAPGTFGMEDEHGRARVHTQWGDDEEAIREAVQSCPVDCIYFVPRDTLPVLEYVMKACKRESVAIMARRRSGNMGSAPEGENPFYRAERFLKLRKDAKIEEVVKRGARMQDDHLAAAIAAAWLALPEGVRSKGWPSWAAATQSRLEEAAATSGVPLMAIAE